MKLKSGLGLFLGIFIFPSCVTTTASWQKKNYSPEKGGVVFYSTEPSLFDPEAVQKRKSDAELKMHRFCKDQRPHIVSEENKEELRGYHSNYSTYSRPSGPSYFRKDVKSSRTGFKKRVVEVLDNTVLSSGGSETQEVIYKKRRYIHFVCR